MRILAGLTLLISVSISSISSATPLELKWSVDVDEAFLGGSELRYIGPLLPTPDGGCVGRAHVVFNGATSRFLFALFFLQRYELRFSGELCTVPIRSFPGSFCVRTHLRRGYPPPLLT